MKKITLEEVNTVVGHIKSFIELRSLLKEREQANQKLVLDVIIGDAIDSIKACYKDTQTTMDIPATAAKSTSDDAKKKEEEEQAKLKADEVEKAKAEADKLTKEKADKEAADLKAKELEKQMADNKKAIEDEAAKKKEEAAKNAMDALKKQAEEKKTASAAASVAKPAESTTERCADINKAYEKLIPIAVERVEVGKKTFRDADFRMELHELIASTFPASEPHTITDTTEGATPEEKSEGRSMRNKAINFIENRTVAIVKEHAIAASKKAKEEAKGKTIDMKPKTETATGDDKQLDTKSAEDLDKAAAAIAAMESKEKTTVAPTVIPPKTLHVPTVPAGTSGKMVNSTEFTEDEKKAAADLPTGQFRVYLAKRMVEKGIATEGNYNVIFDWAVALTQTRKDPWVNEPDNVNGEVVTKSYKFVLRLIESDPELAKYRKAS
ncbi:MAG: hypothetical protein ACP5OA_03490 [Candidatus Woesearchaeota archaeon]